MDGAQIATTSPSSNQAGNITNEWMLYTPQISKTEAVPSDGMVPYS